MAPSENLTNQPSRGIWQSNNLEYMNTIALLSLLQLADSQVPIGSAAHSFGLESLTAEGSVTVEDLHQFLVDYLAETGRRDAVYCRGAHQLADLPDKLFTSEWLTLNQELSAWHAARESRAASATMGRRFLQFAANLSENPRFAAALGAAREATTDVHHATAFGLVGSALGLTEEEAGLVYLQQNIMTLVSAAQRLLPLGQARAGALIWQLQSSVEQAVATSKGSVYSWTPMLDIASMRHPRLMTRLFIS